MKGKSIINKGFPFIMGLYSVAGNPYGNHWVVSVGYLSKSTLSFVKYYAIIDGWGKNDVYINAAWSDVMIYIDK